MLKLNHSSNEELGSITIKQHHWNKQEPINKKNGSENDSLTRIENLFQEIDAQPADPDSIHTVGNNNFYFEEKQSIEKPINDAALDQDQREIDPEVKFTPSSSSKTGVCPQSTLEKFSQIASYQNNSSEGHNQKLTSGGSQQRNAGINWESLIQNKPVILPSQDDRPTILSYGRQMPKNKLNATADTALLMEFLDENERVWSQDELVLVEQVADQLTLALDNAQLFQETQNALAETELLYQASADLNISQSYEDILEVLRKHTFLGNSDRLVSILLFDQVWSDVEPATWMIPLAHWTCLPPESFQTRYLLEKFPAYRLLSAHTVGLFEDIENDERLDSNVRRLFQRNFQSESATFIPLNVAGKWIGVILGAFSQPQKFDQNAVRKLMALSSQAAISIQNIHLLTESQRRANQLQTAAEIARDASSTLALDDLFIRLVNLVCERFGYYHASIFLIDKDHEYAYVRESTGKAGEELKQKGHKLAIGSKSIIGQATLTGRPVVFNDLSSREAKETHYANPLLPLTKSELGIPLKVGSQVIGALNVQSKQPDAFSADDIAILQTLADQIAIAVDNTQAYQMAQQAMEETRKADRLKSQFLANMSHELRTPLNSIIGFSRVILKGIDGPINTLQQQDLTSIYNSGQHLLGLINDILDLSKIEAGKMELAFEENINLGEIINGVMSTTVGLVKDKPITLHHSIDPEIPLLRIDPVKIRQVLLNLLSNAAKFTESGSISLEAKLIQKNSGEKDVMVSVIDTGVGISEADQSKLFQAFSQVDGSLTRKTGGSGLGLSICQHLIQMHHGKIGLSSEVGKGSTFFFSIPIEHKLNLDDE